MGISEPEESNSEKLIMRYKRLKSATDCYGNFHHKYLKNIYIKIITVSVRDLCNEVGFICSNSIITSSSSMITTFLTITSIIIAYCSCYTSNSITNRSSNKINSSCSSSNKPYISDVTLTCNLFYIYCSAAAGRVNPSPKRASVQRP